MSDFSLALIAWQRCNGRHDLPWQGGDAYRVWLSEIMLQQTQVGTVIPYYRRFIEFFPNVVALADATEEQVLAHWSGLGYYARGRNLHRAARMIATQHAGEFPDQFEQLLALPGVGRSTAAAICAQAYHQRHAILDGNVKRVLTRYCGIAGSTAVKSVENQLWLLAESLLPERDMATYTQALMDMGATLCTRSKPKCEQCPVHGACVAYQTGRVAELPTPKARKVVPERHATFLLVMAGREILLEKRGPSGLWGGLWCLPQRDEGDAEYEPGWTIGEQITWPVFTHVFTHFKLHITPRLLRLVDKPCQIQQTGSVWMDVDVALNAAIPTPVRQLLEKLTTGIS
ncbi:MAG: A/G-specific adenine glycosylase [Gallionella sp.]|jgi:A/G-specific adenine glycosylase